MPEGGKRRESHLDMLKDPTSKSNLSETLHDVVYRILSQMLHFYILFVRMTLILQITKSILYRRKRTCFAAHI